MKFTHTIVLAVFLGVLASGCSLFKEKESPGTQVLDLPNNGRAGGSGASGSGRPPQNRTVYVPRISGNTQVSISRARVSGPYLAMTFDDGPHPSNTPKLLDLLRERNIRATFYVVGTNARRYPHLLRQMVAEGHEIGNHTINHLGLARISNQKVRSELGQAHRAIIDACGVPPTTVRPPYGSVTKAQKQWIFDEFGYTTVLWSVDPRDWQRPGSSVVARRLVDGARNGSILLAHDIHSPTITAMPSALDQLLRKGFQFVTVSQLMALQRSSATGPPQISLGELPGEMGPPHELAAPVGSGEGVATVSLLQEP